jgi:hypothetical protein
MRASRAKPRAAETRVAVSCASEQPVEKLPRALALAGCTAVGTILDNSFDIATME